MIIYKVGDIFESSAKALVNTVNCEGFMGKGLAYQFKKRYPNMFNNYKQCCDRGELTVGQVHWYNEDNKIIINFPTKNKWRGKSKIEYVDTGLDALAKVIIENNIDSIAIPPLGSGNGGLNWIEVKKLIEEKLKALSSHINIEIYEPSNNINSNKDKEPMLSERELALMKIKLSLEGKKLTQSTLNYIACIMDIYADKKIFNFKSKDGLPVDLNLKAEVKLINDFQKYHNVNTEEAYKILYGKLTSTKCDKMLKIIDKATAKSASLINSFSNKNDIEGIALVLSILSESDGIDTEYILNCLRMYYDNTNKTITKSDVEHYMELLLNSKVIQQNFIGYSLI